MCGADCAPSSSTSAPTSRARADQHVDGVDGAEQVALVDERQHLGALVDQPVEVGQVEPALVGQREPAQRRAGALAEHLPRHEVGVVLHLGHADLVAGSEVEPLPGPPSPFRALPNEYATRLYASVAFLVNTTSSCCAPRKAAIVLRACS